MFVVLAKSDFRGVIALVKADFLPNNKHAYRTREQQNYLPQSIHLAELRIAVSPVITMAVDEATQTNGVPEPTAGQLKQEQVAESKWTVESGMS